MGREWTAHDDNGICDGCGKQGFVWDFYGEFLCPECAHEALADEDAEEDDDLQEAWVGKPLV